MKTFASVTDTPCNCDYLHNSAADPDHPIEFEPSVHEFLFVDRADDGTIRSKLSIYHCPFCGGAAPASKRATLFAPVPHSENVRIRALFSDTKTMAAVLEKFGQPDYDHPNGFSSITPERDGSPPTHYSGRSMQYTKLSEVADVDVAEHRGGNISVSLSGKFIGPKDPA
jgi:hypothetical protein